MHEFSEVEVFLLKWPVSKLTPVYTHGSFLFLDSSFIYYATRFYLTRNTNHNYAMLAAVPSGPYPTL